MARKCVPDVPIKKALPLAPAEGPFRKNVKLPLSVFIEGRSKAEVVAVETKLVEYLKSNLPIKARLGRGKKEAICIDLRQ